MSLNEQQIKAINHDLGNILVSASAGSGKTHTMIERVKRLVIEKNIKINELLVVTFTESAAQDMKQKLKNALSKVISGQTDEKYSASVIKNCEEQLAEVDTADISTMHAFCAKLIRSYFFICGLAPDFKILDASDASVIKNTAIERTFRDFYDEGEEWFLSLVDRHAQGRQDANLKSLILSAYDFCDSESNPLSIAELYKDIYTEDGFESLLKRYKEQLDESFKSFLDKANFARKVFIDAGKEKAIAFTETLIENIDFALNAKDLYALNVLKDFKLLLNVERNLDEFCKEQKNIVADIRKKFAAMLESALSVISENKQNDLQKFLACGEYTAQFVRVLTRYKSVYEQLKREENALDFNDLEHFALEILSENEVNEEIKNKYKFIFVDEFQDVNGVQDEIISKIETNNVFMVGDAKQSIYGFRGCRAKFFMEKDKLLTENGQTVVRLNQNYRSAKEVIYFVNRVFNFCMTESVYGESYEQRSQLQSGGIYPEEMVGRAELHLLLKEEKEQTKVEQPKIYDLLNVTTEQEDTSGLRSAMQVADIILSELKKKVYDVKLQTERPVEYKDIAILTRNKSGAYVADLVKGFRKLGIPVTADSNENVCDYPEVMVMINALKLVDCFMQDLPLASTLKSPIGGFNEEELFEIACYYRDNVGKHGGFSDAFNEYLNNAKTPLQVRLAEFKAYFDGVRTLSDFIGAHGVIQKLITDKNLEAHLYAKKEGAEKVDRLNRFLQASIVNGKTLTVREFLKRVENCPEAFDISPFASENTVKVMTIHSSKGLEFPVVIVCGLERAFNREDDSAEILLDREFGFALKYYEQEKREVEETILRNFIRNNFEKQRIQEEMRLFYVALTRATYSLHLVVEDKENTRSDVFTSASKFYHFLPKGITESVCDYQSVKTQVREAHPRKVIIGKADEEIKQKIKDAVEFCYPYNDDVSLPLKSSVTELSAKNDDVVLTHVLFDEQSPDTERGTIAHKLLEHYDFESENNVYKQASSMVEKGVLLESELLKINLDRIAVALDSGAFCEIKGKKLFREQPFIFNIPAKEIFQTESRTSVLVQGVIDLLVIDDVTAQIIDYKYSSLDEQSLKLKYDKQLKLYATAVERVLNKKVTKKVLVNIFTGQTVLVE